MTQLLKNLFEMQDTQVRPLGQGDPLEIEWQPTPVILPREFHGQRSLTGYSPWVCKESNTVEQISLSLYSFYYCFSFLLT